MGELIEGAVQHAPQWGRQSMTWIIGGTGGRKSCEREAIALIPDPP
jgi:hypothetical protein